MPMKKDVVVVIPVYRQFTPSEKLSFRQCLKVLGGHDISVVQPESLDIDYQVDGRVNFSVRKLDGRWFTSIEAYNSLMLSTEFYEGYSGYEYILIYQLDAFVFHDSLKEWVEKGYDYVGAPWMPNSNFYQRIVGDFVRFVRRTIHPAGSTSRVTHAQMHYHVGNGGFSLRRVEKMHEVVTRFAGEISQLQFGKAKAAQEDVFLSVYISKRAGIRMPRWREALQFSFENNPERSLKVTGGKLPFGCHAWSKGNAWKDFWYRFIPQPE